jgi:hypothetical protein
MFQLSTKLAHLDSKLSFFKTPEQKPVFKTHEHVQPFGEITNADIEQLESKIMVLEKQISQVSDLKRTSERGVKQVSEAIQ